MFFSIKFPTERATNEVSTIILNFLEKKIFWQNAFFFLLVFDYSPNNLILFSPTFVPFMSEFGRERKMVKTSCLFALG